MDNYYNYKALFVLDYNICNKIVDPNLRSRCIVFTQKQQAIENTNLKLCNVLT